MSTIREAKRPGVIPVIQYLMLPAAILLVWQVLFQFNLINVIMLPPPAKVARSFWELTVSGRLFVHVSASILRVFEGFALASVLGLSLGVLIGLSNSFDRATDLFIKLLRPIPPIAWIPMAILWFGIGEMSKIYIIFLGSFFPIVINVTSAIRQTDSRYIEVARTLEVTRVRLIREVIIPGAFPSIMTSLRVGLGIAWVCVVAAELIAATRGIGYLIMDARQLSQPDVVIVGMITIGVVGTAMEVILRKLERRLIRWRKDFFPALTLAPARPCRPRSGTSQAGWQKQEQE